MPNAWMAAQNVGAKVARRALALHKPVLRVARRASRLGEQGGYVAAELRTLSEIAAVARGTRPIVVGPWLSEVGYEALYWVPFVRWFCDYHRVAPDRLVLLSRGGVAAWYGDSASRYVELLDLMPPSEFVASNEERRTGSESGGQKQSFSGVLDAELIQRARGHLGLGEVNVLHPSLMYRLFRQFWYGNRALDFLLTHLRFAAPKVADIMLPPLPPRFTAVKLYAGRALPDTPEHRRLLRELVAVLAAEEPVVLLDTGLALDEHQDYEVARGATVVRLQEQMTPQNNLAMQTEAIRRATRFVGTCGSLAWLAPLLGTDTVALYADDRLLTTHLYVARQAYRQVDGCGMFAPLDLSAAALLAG